MNIVSRIIIGLDSVKNRIREKEDRLKKNNSVLIF